MATAADSQARILPLSSRSEVAERTLEFRFPRPRSMTFKAGQFVDLTLLDPVETDAEGNARLFPSTALPPSLNSSSQRACATAPSNACCDRCHSAQEFKSTAPEDAPFLDEMYGLERENPRFTFVPTMTRMDDFSFDTPNRSSHSEGNISVLRGIPWQELALAERISHRIVFAHALPVKLRSTRRLSSGSASVRRTDEAH